MSTQASNSALSRDPWRTGQWLTRAGVAGAIVVVGATCLYPFLAMTAIAFTPNSTAYSGQLIPAEPTTANFKSAFQTIPFLRLYLNSIFIAVWVTTLQVVTSSMAAYAFARLQWFGRDKVFLGYLATLMLPAAVTMVPSFLLLRELGWIDCYKAVIIPASSTTFGTFMLRQFFLSIPRDFEEAAQIDGAGHAYIFLRVILPLSAPAISTLAALVFMGSWQSYLMPMLVMRSSEKMPLYVGLASFQGAHGTAWGPMMAGSLIAILPVIAIFVLAQKYIVEAIQGGVKG